jgi:hypothetical protein
VIFSFESFAQMATSLPPGNEALSQHIATIERDEKFNSDSASLLLSSWNDYPLMKAPNRNYLFLYKDSTFVFEIFFV